jgi:cytochrome c oxidase subunit I+III
MGWGNLNLLSTIGAVTLVAGIFLSLVNAVASARRGAVAPADPWGAGTLEWHAESPPRICNFPAIPVVYGRDPLWQGVPAGLPDHVAGLAADMREVLTTTVADARPDSRMLFPEPTPWPFLAAVATTIFFIGSIFTPWAIVWGSIPVLVTLVAWFWPKARETAAELALEKAG